MFCIFVLWYEMHFSGIVGLVQLGFQMYELRCPEYGESDCDERIKIKCESCISSLIYYYFLLYDMDKYTLLPA